VDDVGLVEHGSVAVIASDNFTVEDIWYDFSLLDMDMDMVGEDWERLNGGEAGEHAGFSMGLRVMAAGAWAIGRVRVVSWRAATAS